MAFTASFITDSVMGKYRVRVHNVTPDAATGSFDTGLRQVIFAVPTVKAMTSFIASGNTSQTFPHFTENALAVGTSAVGYIGITGCVSGDIYRVVSFGPS